MISVIIPTYNEAALLLRAVQSALDQTFPPNEVIVVDDASSDGTAAALATVDDPRLKVIVHEQNSGAAAARNTGIQAAHGEWIAFLDADDLWHPEKLARQMDYLSRHPAETACVCGFQIRGANGAVRPYPQPLRDHAAVVQELVRGCHLSTSSTLLIRCDAFAHAGLFNTSLKRFEDWEWLWRLVAHDRIGFVEDILVTIDASPWPEPEVIKAATAAMEPLLAAHILHVTGKASDVRVMRAWLQLETAIGYFYQSNYWHCMMHCFAALFNAPLAVGRYFVRRFLKL